MKARAPASRSALQHTGVRLSDFLAADSVELSMKATTKEEALAELILLLPISQTDRNITLATLGQRESIGSTGVGMGVAIPHCRSTTFSKLMVAFGRSPKGVAYQAVDKKKVRLFFLVVSPPIELTNFYHPVLAAIVNLTKEDHNRNRLLEAESAAEVRTILSGAVS
ncbi:MAG: PTS sugar transporter subunit IIA [bacterium]